MTAWRYEFDDVGGYDCMTGGFAIYRDDALIAKIDLIDFGQDLNGTLEDAKARALPVVVAIVEAMNEKEKP